MIKIGIYGATGYTGLELLRLLQRHPQAQIAWLTSENSAGQKFGDVFNVPPAIGETDADRLGRRRPRRGRPGLLLPAARRVAGAGGEGTRGRRQGD